MNRRRHQFVMFLVVLFTLVGCKDSPSLTLADGQQQTLSDYKGQWLVVNYFAQWCAPCLREMPLLNELANQDAPAVLAVSFDVLSSEKLQQLSQQYKMTMPIAAKLSGDWPFDSPRALPTTLLLDPKGKLVASHQGELHPEDIANWRDKYWAKR
ncbi:TlpA family protein disulfide reductase [Oceanisphaera avium]|uniref:Redoxin n=1 Tax=Oceanisphaera avium TaxID=1903694 RepID=A0A1Y0D1C1_9GAMM|nr:TlpA disulfide reductase family protein [Oceanisphaera avium]ART81027.1 redoxin [Oceanisphaera avium]